MRKFAAGLLSILGLAGTINCDHAAADDLDWGVTISSGRPPPPVVYSAAPPIIRPQPVWVADYWYWNGAAYVLIPAHWEQPRGSVGYVQPAWGVSLGTGRHTDRSRQGDRHHERHDRGHHGHHW